MSAQQERARRDPRVVALVVRREVTERVRTRSFRVTTVLIALVAIAAVIIPHLIDSGGKTRYDVGLVGDVPTSVGPSLVRSGQLIDADVGVRRLDDEASAVAAVRSETIDVAIVGTDHVVVRRTLAPTLEALVDQAVSTARASDSLSARGVSPAEVDSLLRPPPLPVRRLDPPSRTNTANKSLAFGGCLFLYLSLLSFGLVVANGVVEEKSTRVSEILLGAMRPSQLLAGKVIGIGIVGSLQLLAVGLPAAVAALVVGSLDVPTGTPLTFGAIGLWFLLGFAFYSCAFAAAGASVSRAEEVGNATMPLTMLLLAAYLIGVTAATGDPDSPLVRVASFLPPLMPMVMLARAAVGDVSLWVVPVAMVVEVASTWLLVRVAGRVYTGAIVRTGPRVKLRQAWRSAER
ncbi:MAG TPA: ABC transporter permease [Acidimicrobiales bacterium]|nr:ABC transporter permease [Acidimicrobiales bacterium]